MNNHLFLAISRIRRSPYQTLSAISIMTMTLFLGSVFFLLAAGSDVILHYFETRPQINAYYKQDFVPTSDQINTLKTTLISTGEVSEVKYVTKDDALALYKDLNKNDPLLLEAVTADMLPASIEVSAKDPRDLAGLADKLKTQEGIDDVRYAQDIVSSLTKWTSSVRLIGLCLVGAHIFITFMVIMLIIGLKVRERRDEITLLQLVGAGRGYIAAPFIWEGIIYGLIGAVIAWGTTYLILLYSTGFLIGFLGNIPVLPPPILFMFELLGAELALGSVVGGTSGIIAVRRYLKS